MDTVRDTRPVSVELQHSTQSDLTQRGQELCVVMLQEYALIYNGRLTPLQTFQLNSIQFMLLNLIPNHQTQNDGGTVNDIRGTHIVEQFFRIGGVYSRVYVNNPLISCPRVLFTVSNPKAQPLSTTPRRINPLYLNRCVIFLFQN